MNAEAKLHQDAKLHYEAVAFEAEHEQEIDDAIGFEILANPSIVLDALAELNKEQLIKLGYAARWFHSVGISDVVAPVISVYIREHVTALIKKKHEALKMHDQQYCDPCNSTIENCDCGEC